jgi:hypothetical protein
MEYTQLTDEDQRTMIRKRLRIYEEQHFDAVQNLRMSRATHAPAMQIDELETKVADLETCIGILASDLKTCIGIMQEE